MMNQHHLLEQIEKAKNKELIKDFSVSHTGGMSYIYVTLYTHTPKKTKEALLAYITGHYLCQAILSDDLLSIIVPSLSDVEFSKWMEEQLRSTDTKPVEPQ